MSEGGGRRKGKRGGGGMRHAAVRCGTGERDDAKPWFGGLAWGDGRLLGLGLMLLRDDGAAAD